MTDPIPSMRIILIAAAALLALGGCSDSTGASGLVTGEWRYEVLDVGAEDDPVSCSYTDVVIRLEQRGSRLSGHTDGGFGTCARQGEPPFPGVPLRPASISGTVDGAAVQLLMGDFLLNEGTLVADEIRGTATFAAGVEGSFTMSRR